MQDIAANITENLRNYMRVFYDDSALVSETFTNNTVIIRDTMAQERINKENLV